jgi:hypothetical protein
MSIKKELNNCKMIYKEWKLQKEEMLQVHKKINNCNCWKIKLKNYKSSLIALKDRFKITRNQDLDKQLILQD